MKNSVTLLISLMLAIMLVIGLPSQARERLAESTVVGEIISVSQPAIRNYKIPGLEDEVANYVTVKVKTENGDVQILESRTGVDYQGIGYGFDSNIENYLQVSKLKPNESYSLITIKPIMGTMLHQIINYSPVNQ